MDSSGNVSDGSNKLSANEVREEKMKLLVQRLQHGNNKVRCRKVSRVKFNRYNQNGKQYAMRAEGKWLEVVVLLILRHEVCGH